MKDYVNWYNYIIDFIEHQDNQLKIKPRTQRTRCLKRQKEKESEPSPSLGQEDFHELIVAEIEQDKEFWLGKVNDHLEKLLKKANKNNMLQIHSNALLHQKQDFSYQG